MLLVCALVATMLSGITVFAAEETVTVVADGSWTNATYDPDTGILTNVDDGYSFKITLSKNVYYINSAGTPIEAETVYFPASFTYSGGEIELQQIGQNAIPATSVTKTVYIPNTITKFSNKTFATQTSLETVIFAEGFTGTTFAEYMFNGCSNLKNITIPETITTINSKAFINCTSLESINLPKAIKSFSTAGVFAGCPNLSITVDPESTYLKVDENGFLYSLSKSKENALLFVPANTTIESYTTPASLTNIGGNTFNGIKTLKEVTIGDAVTTLSDSAFEECSNLETINFSSAGKLKTIAEECFLNCSSLKSVIIPEGVTTISADSIFSGCTSLETFSTPTTATAIGKNFFNGCTSLKNVTINEGPTLINNRAFMGSGIETINIPSSVTQLGEYVFTGCANLTTVNFGDNTLGRTNSTKTIFDGCDKLTTFTFGENFAWADNTIPASFFNSCVGLTSFEVPDYVTTIGNSAFANSGLASITLPEGLTTIGESAFLGTDLVSVVVPDTVTTLGKKAFYQCTSLESAVISKGVTAILSECFSLSNKLDKVILRGPVASIEYRGFMQAPLTQGLIFEQDVVPALGSSIFTSRDAMVYYPTNAVNFPLDTTLDATIVKDVMPFGGHISAVTDDGTNTTVEYTAVDVYDNAAVKAVVAVYDNSGALLAAKTVDGTEPSITFEGVTGVKNAKIYMWDGMSLVKPLYESFEVVK